MVSKRTSVTIASVTTIIILFSTLFLISTMNVEGIKPPLKKELYVFQDQKIYIHPFSIRPLKQDFYHLDEPIPVFPEKLPLDSQGIPMFRDKKTRKLYNHPVRLAHHTINNLTSFQMTKDSRYLENARKYLQRLVDIAVIKDVAMYFPYEFDVYLHNIPSEHLDAPWYSGMAQGQALSAFTRMYQITKEEKYLKWAHQVFASFQQLKSKGHSEWVTMVDQHYYWIEEYPLEEPTKVLNGYIFAIYGLYDYYQVTKSEKAKFLLQASLTTIYDHILDYRKEDDASLYGLKHDHQSWHYHLVHIEQLQALYQITGNEYFQEVSEVFQDDYNSLSFSMKRLMKWLKTEVF